MLDESPEDRPVPSKRSPWPNGARRLDGAIEWHPPRIAAGLLAKLHAATSWSEAAAVLGTTISEAIGASSPRVWMVDRTNRHLQQVDRGGETTPPAQAFDPHSAEWLLTPGVRRIHPEELTTDPLLRGLFGPISPGGFGLLLTTAPESVPATCIAWAIDESSPLPEWVGRVLSEFAVGVPSWWAMLAKCRDQSKRLEAMEKDRGVAMACRGLLHDLDNAIFPIRCRIDLLFSPLRSADEMRHLEAISASIDQLSQLGADLRSRLDRDGGPAEPANLSEWWDLNRDSIAASLPPHATLLGAVPETLPPVAMPESALTQVVVNLAANAGKAIGRDGAVVVAAREIEHRRVRITVSDNGSGMSEGTLDELRRTIRSRREAGLAAIGSGDGRRGFGLAMVEELVERSGGSLEIHSKSGQGTRVEIVVPIAWRGEASSRFAIVEVDDSRRRWVIAEMLRSAGVHILPREDPPEPSAGENGRHSRSDDDALATKSGSDATIWIADGPHADSPSLLEWLEGDERRMAIAIGEPSRPHARIRSIEDRLDDQGAMAAFRALIEPTRT